MMSKTTNISIKDTKIFDKKYFQRKQKKPQAIACGFSVIYFAF